MRYDKDFLELYESGNFTGDNRPNGVVTIEADWKLNTTSTGSNWGNSIRGPYRWWRSAADDQTEIVVPNLKTISRNHALSQDAATCNIVLYNQWHDALGATGATPAVDNLPEDYDQLGKPGYFWPGHGSTTESDTLWGQSTSTGAVDKDGNTVSGFEWQNALVPYALLRTYEGYGGHDKNLQTALNDGDLFQTGVWLVDAVRAGSDGLLYIECKDMVKLLIDQIIQAPLVPNALYPLEYVPDGKSAFDSFWEPQARSGVSPASQGRIPIQYNNSSSTTPQYGHAHSHSVDKRDDTYAISDGETTPNGRHHWWLYKVTGSNGKNIDQIQIRPWAGGYTCYVSISEDNSTWLGTKTIPGTPADTAGVSKKYVAKVTIPLAIPDGKELPVNVSIPSAYTGNDIKYICLTFTNFYYGNFKGQTTDVYRCGIREVIAYDIKQPASNYTSDFADLPWTYSMTAHPTRGYWVLDDSGNIYEFGDAIDYGGCTINTVNGHINYSVAMASTPSGNGYWILQRDGTVTARGDASLYATGGGWTDGSHYTTIGADLWGAQGLQAFDIAPTYTGLGYYIVFGNGVVIGFGDAASTSGMSYKPGVGTSYVRPVTKVDAFMDALPITILVKAANPLGFTRQKTYTYDYCRRGTSVTASPNSLGFWVTSGSGEVNAVGKVNHYGQLVQRVYNAGSADSFRLTVTEFATAIRATETGKGYWIAFGSGHIAAFGDARGQGPSYIYAAAPPLDLDIPDDEIQDWSFFRALIWNLEPDPDKSGFWLLAADGSVGSYNAEFWGQPGYHNASGFRWFEGNYNDYSDIVKEVLLWSGFLLYDAAQPGDEEPPVFGSIESTGIPSDARFPADQFDRKKIIDVINELKQVVGYSIWAEWDGSITFTSPNFWQAGNIDNSGTAFSGGRIYIDESDDQTNDPEDTLYIPTVSDEVSILNYSASLIGDALRSEIVIGNNQPDYKDPSTTGYVRYYPPTASEEIRTGVPALRNIIKPAAWIQEAWENTEEMELMAELIHLQIWFSQRTGSVQIPGNPLWGINDQITINERNTSEVFLHYIRALQSELDLDSGVYTYTLTTNWLGLPDNWVIVADDNDSGLNRIAVSNRVDKWQSQLGLGLPDSLSSINNPFELFVTGEFTASSVPVDPEAATPVYGDWEFTGTISAAEDVELFEFTVLQFSEILGSATVTIETNEATPSEIDSDNMPIAGNVYELGGTLDAGEYIYTITGTASSRGSAVISLSFNGSNIEQVGVDDSTVIVDIS